MSDGSSAAPTEAPPSPPSRRRVLLPTAITVVVLLILGGIFTTVWTNRLWFNALGYGSVYRTQLGTRTGLFVAFGLFFAVVVLVNVAIAYRRRPPTPPGRIRPNDPVARYREGLDPVRKPAFVLLGVVLFAIAGAVAGGRWQTFLLWRNSTSFGTDDEYFGRDVSFYVFDYPWLRFVTTYGFVLLAVALLATAAVYYLYGAISWQTPGRRVSRPAAVHLSVLGALFLFLKAWAYYLDRFGFAMSDGTLHTGISYTDANARIPSKEILIVIALICGVLLLVNVVRDYWLLPLVSIGLLALSSILIGGIWPAIMQSFQVNPSEPDKEAPYIAMNIDATRDAYDISDVEEEDYDAQVDVSAAQLPETAETRVSTRLLDPTLVAPAFEQLQQVRGYYSVPQTLDVDRYVLPGEDQPQDVVIAARELNLEGLSSSQRTWANDHTVFTHGYGLIAARGNERTPEGEPVWVEKDIPSQGDFDYSEAPRIYYGENFEPGGPAPTYSIVGQEEGADPIEVDVPQGSTDDPDDATQNTYDGSGGVGIGGLFNQVLYAVKFGEPNIVLSDRVNAESKILYDRSPRERVEKVAPWLTVDGDPYPALVDGRVVWIVDGYTTSDSYPLAEQRSLQEATQDTLTGSGAQATLPTDQISYIRNSVKAVVDAYDGTVELYEWDEEDPVLQTWMKAFPGVVQDKSEIDESLLEHLRYPVDLFKVQRDILTRYHVTDPQLFYQDGERWVVPADPSSASGGTLAQPPYYLSTARPGTEEPNFSLTSVLVPNERENLAAYVSVNSEASNPEEYGKMQILTLPSDTQVQGPNQVNNQFASDDGVRDTLLKFTRDTSITVDYGNLLTVPVADGLLYVQPVYTQANEATGTYPLLRNVIASFGDSVGIGTDLDGALRDALGLDPATSNTGGNGGDGGGDGGTLTGDPQVDRLIRQANTLYEEAQAALREEDFGTYGQKIERVGVLLAQALSIQDAGTGGTDTPSDGATDTPTDEPTDEATDAPTDPASTE